MAYIYEVSFHIKADQMDELELGSSLERVIGYLRTRVPGEPGFMQARAQYSLDIPEKTLVVLGTVWAEWADLVRHRETGLTANKALVEFAPDIGPNNLTIHVYQEVD